MLCKWKNVIFYYVWVIFHCVCVWVCVCVCIYMTSSLSTHLMMDTGCFHTWAIVNNASMNCGVCVSFWICCFSFFSNMPRSRFAEFQGSSNFIFLRNIHTVLHSCCSVFRLYPTLCNPMDWTTPDFPVLHSLLKFAQTFVHWVNDAIQPYYPLSSLLFMSSIIPSIRVFSSELALCNRWPKYWSFCFSISPSSEYSGLISFRIDYLISLQSKWLSGVFSSTTVQKHPFLCAEPYLWSNSHICTWLLEKP